MQRGKVRNWLLVVLVVLAAASMFPSLGGSSHGTSVPPARHPALVAKQQAQSPPAHTTPVRTDP
jgi:hypothetical protein